MFKLICEDLSAQTNDGSWGMKFKCLLLNHSVHMLILVRLGFWLAKSVPLFGGILRHMVEYLVRILFASDISCRAKIGGGFNIMHGHDIVIGSGVVIGRNCKIFNGVTLGNKDTESSKVEQPYLEDNVVIGSGAKILGGVKIGQNSRIGANSVVLKDVPANTTWAGVPAREIKKLNFDKIDSSGF